MSKEIETDLCIIGAGPVGLFAVFEAGLLKLRSHLVDVLPQPGGQLSEIYPKKPIYDIPGYPTVLAQELIENLQKQIAPFHPTFSLGEKIESFEKLGDGSFLLNTSDHTVIHARAVVIAAGLGSFEPRKPDLKHLGDFEGKGVHYFVKDPSLYVAKQVVIAGGGDSALDWAIYLAAMDVKVALVHRNNTFRGAPDTADKVFQLADEQKITLFMNAQVTDLQGNPEGFLTSAIVSNDKGELITLDTDYFIPLFGLSPKLGPIEHWKLNLDKNAVVVNTEDFGTDIPGLFAIGDINAYPGKLKLILCGFHEAALMSHGAYKYIYPEKKINLKYTTVNGVEAF